MALGMVLSLSGCASLEPAPTVDVPAEPSWVAQARVDGGGEERGEEAPLTDRWWTSFGDPELDALVEEGLEANRDLAAAAARLEQAWIQARIAGADLAPQVNGSFNGSRRKQNFIGFPIPGGEEEVLSSTTSTFGVSLDVSWEVDLWGRLRAGRDAATEDLAAAQADYAAARLSLAAQTSKAYFAVREAELQRALAQETLESRQASSSQVRRRYEAGLRTALDLRLALSSEASAEASLEGRRLALQSARRQLEVLVGRYPAGRVLTVQGSGEEPEASPLALLPGPVPAGLPAELVRRRPDLAAAERRLVAAGYRVEQARAALYPGLSLTASVGTSSQELEDLLDGDFSVWSLAGGLLQPIFQGGRLRAAVELQEASQEQALAGYAQNILQAFSEVETSLASEGSLQTQVVALERAAEQSLGAERLSQERYLAGLVGYLTVLESQRQALSTRSQLLDAQRRLLNNRVDLVVALGGGLDAESWLLPSGFEERMEAAGNRFPDAPVFVSEEDLASSATPNAISSAEGSSAEGSSAEGPGSGTASTEPVGSGSPGPDSSGFKSSGVNSAGAALSRSNPSIPDFSQNSSSPASLSGSAVEGWSTS
ncbi:MAG: efflux transporter outer membrane subunit [Acidobacteriota bacterium]